MLQRIKNKINRIESDFRYNFLPKLTYLAKSKTNTILMYHGIDSKGDNLFNSRHTSLSYFEKQLSFLSKYCNVISIEDYFNQKFDSAKSNIAITFDDGYLNNSRNARPIIEKYKTPVTFFVTGINNTEKKILWADYLDLASFYYRGTLKIEGDVFVNKAGRFIHTKNNKDIYNFVKNINPSFEFKNAIYSELDNFMNEIFTNEKFFELWKIMPDREIKNISKSKYISIGSHGYYHNNLGVLPYKEAMKELELSKCYLEHLIQTEVNSVGYPDGSYNSELLNGAYELGFRFQLATENYTSNNHESDKRILTRKGVYNCDSWGNQLL